MGLRPDAAAIEALGRDVRRPITIAWLDILGEPIRVTNAPYSLTFAGTGDEDLDGFTFSAVDPRFVSIGPVKMKEGGSDTVTLKLSGLPVIDDDTLTTIGDKANWQGRPARLWRAMLDPADLSRLGAVWGFYTGFMNVPTITGDKTSQVIALEVESFAGFFTQASNRSYLQQDLYDPGDRSAELAIAIANGATRRK